MRNPRTALLVMAVVGIVVGLGAYTLWYSRAYAYLSDDPKACTNCHIMADAYQSWGVSVHRNVSCNDCHIPHDALGKYAAKVEDGVRHSTAFTFENVQVPRSSSKTLNDIQQNCIRCHESSVSLLMNPANGSDPECAHCHATVSHIP